MDNCPVRQKMVSQLLCCKNDCGRITKFKNEVSSKINLILVFIISIFGSVIAQDHLYYTRNASLQVHGEFQGESLYGITKQLGITPDYETTEINPKLNLNNLIFNESS